MCNPEGFTFESMRDEIARLHAEVERLKAMTVTGEVVIEETDIGVLRELFERWWKESFERTERERDEARAQVAVLLRALEDALSEIHYTSGCDARCEERRHVLASPTLPARVLLDRLQRAEAVVRAAEEFEVAWIDKVDRGLLILKVIALGDALAAYRERA